MSNRKLYALQIHTNWETVRGYEETDLLTVGWVPWSSNKNSIIYIITWWSSTQLFVKIQKNN